MDVARLAERIAERYANEPEFVQAVGRTLREVEPVFASHPHLDQPSLLARLLEPDRLIQFRVDWEDDQQRTHVHRGYRVQWNDALGPYKGGIRFHPSVNQSILKFLAFEQTFKNSLTGLPLGGAKGGSDFDPHGRSTREIRRFCRAFALELQRHVGREHDVPAGDIGVGSREIGWLYGQFRRFQPDVAEALTGKPTILGGSELRTEATGWGVVYFAAAMLAHADDSLEGKVCAVSGAGNVALYTARKLLDRGARVVTLSDSKGFVHKEGGLSCDDVDRVEATKAEGGSLRDFAEEAKADWDEGRPWGVPCDAAFPSATQNELDGDDAKRLVQGGCRFVFEGANMPCTEEAEACFHEAEVGFAPSKAANAGGVAVSEFEMAQAASRQRWSREKVDARLRETMEAIHARCVEHGSGRGPVDYAAGATRAAFLRIADAMLRF